MSWTCNNCTYGRHDECKGTVAGDTCACRCTLNQLADAVTHVLWLHDEGAKVMEPRPWLDAMDRAINKMRAALPRQITHGRHCPCSACKRQDWAEPHLAACGMHGPDCPPVYAPLKIVNVGLCLVPQHRRAPHDHGESGWFAKDGRDLHSMITVPIGEGRD